MRLQNLRELPKLRDSWSYLYLEHCKIDCDHKAVAAHDASGKTPIPCAHLTLLMLGPGVSITHAAVLTLSDHGCTILWCGEQGIRFYAQGLGETRKSARLLRQIELWADKGTRTAVVRKMYELRFQKKLDTSLTIQQIRGMEGVRVREAYAQASREYGVPWHGRKYDRTKWTQANPINRALSTAHACLYGLCHAAIVSCGYSPAIGFIHTGHMTSFVFDIADLYKSKTTVPTAFRAVAAEQPNLDRSVRLECRDAFHQAKLLEKIVTDLDKLMNMNFEEGGQQEILELWDPEESNVAAGRNYQPDNPLHS